MEKQRVVSAQTGEKGWLLDVIERSYLIHSYEGAYTEYSLVGIVAMDSGDIVELPFESIKIEGSMKGGDKQ